MNQFENYVKLNRKIPPELLVSLNQINDHSKLADTMAAHLNTKLSDKQALLEVSSVKERFNKIIDFIDQEIGVLQVEKKIRSRVKKQMDKTQKEYYLTNRSRQFKESLEKTQMSRMKLTNSKKKQKK